MASIEFSYGGGGGSISNTNCPLVSIDFLVIYMLKAIKNEAIDNNSQNAETEIEVSRCY